LNHVRDSLQLIVFKLCPNGRESLTWFNSSQWFDSKGICSRYRSTRV